VISLKTTRKITFNWRAGQLVLDEPAFNDGSDIGSDPFTTVLSGIVAVH
jgi:putative redox protein